MMLFVIFPSTWISQLSLRVLLQLPFKENTVDYFTFTRECFFFFEKTLFMILYMHVPLNNFFIFSQSVPIFQVFYSIMYLLYLPYHALFIKFLYLSCIYYFCHIMLYFSSFFIFHVSIIFVISCSIFHVSLSIMYLLFLPHHVLNIWFFLNICEGFSL